MKGALHALDDAIELVRSTPFLRSLRCAAPGLGLTWLALTAYYLERVEGVRSLRAPLALGCVLLWCTRALVMGRYAGEQVRRLLGESAPAQGSAQALLGAGLALGCELWLWTWLLVAALRIDPWSLLAVLPLFALRGALAPSWLAACDALPEGGVLRAGLHALRSAQGQRLRGIACELTVLLGALALFCNVGALAAALISLSQDLLGLSLAFVRAFISPGNHFALLALAGAALSAFEPVRAALSAVLWVQNRERRELLRVTALVEGLLARTLLVSLLLTSPAVAQDEPLLQPEAECDAPCLQARARDDALLVELVSLLDDDSFREFPDERWSVGEPRSAEDWLEAFLAWLKGDGQPEAIAATGKPRSAQVRVTLVVGLGLLGALVLAVLLRLLLRPSTRTPARSKPSRAAPSSQLRSTGELRALYLDTLDALAQRGLLQLADHHSNGDYVRSLLHQRERALLQQLTHTFERSQYGRVAPSDAELQHAQQLARQLREAS